MKLRSFYFLAVFAGLVSCSDDESNTNNTPLLTVTAAAGSLTRETWIFLTKEDGTLIDAKEITGDGADVVFERPSGFKDKAFVVNQLNHSTNSRAYGISSYTAVTGGKLSLNAINPGTGITEVATHNYSFTNVPSGYSTWMSGPNVLGYSGSCSNGTCSGTVSLGQNNIGLLYWLQQNGNPLAVPKYTLVNAADGETLAMSFNDLIPASEQTITFAGKQDFVETYMAPASTELPDMTFYSIFNWSNATEIKLYYPGEAWDAYLTIIEAQLGNDRQRYAKTGSIPTSFKSMPATINSFSQASNSFTVTTSGAYDWLQAYGVERWTDNALEYSISWTVYMDDTNTKTFTIPSLPEAIIARYPVLNNASGPEFSLIDVSDHSNLDNYQDFISLYWNTKAFAPDTEYFLRRKLIAD